MATQDRALRVALGQRPGGASVFVSVNGVHLEPPSDSQKAQSGQVRRLRVDVQSGGCRACMPHKCVSTQQTRPLTRNCLRCWPNVCIRRCSVTVRSGV